LFNVLVAVVGIALWIVLFVVFLVVSQVSGALATILSLVSLLVWLVFGIGILAGWVLCLVKAFQSQYFKLPVIGNFAEKFSTK
jgi:uncharacterized membrane protein